MIRNRVMFPAPHNAADEGNDEQEIRAMFGLTDSTEDTVTDTTNGASEETDPKAFAPEEHTDSNKTSDEIKTESTDPEPNDTTPKEEEPVNPEDKFTKQNSAFAQMRIQNKQYAELIMSLARATGQDVSSMDDAQELLKNSLTKVVAKDRNIPEDVLREMEADKKELAELRQNQAKQHALAGFQQVKDLYGLSRKDIDEFADQLIEQHINPFETTNVNLLKEYRYLNFDKLIASAKEQGANEERARSMKAQQSSTTPSTQQGLPEGTGTQGNPIKSVRDLDKLLDSLK